MADVRRMVISGSARECGARWLCMFGIIIAAGCSNGADTHRTDYLKARLETPGPDDVIVVAHRTCWRDTAENSLAGIDRCVELGVDMIEIDVRRSKDGELVLIHDDTVDRTTNGRGLVAEHTLQQFGKLRLRAGAGGNNAPLTQEGVPTLEEALRVARNRILVNLDIKEALYDQALQIARRVGSQDEIIIKMTAPADDPRLLNAAFHGQTYFMPIVRECNDDPERVCTLSLSAALPAYEAYDPVAVEVVNHTDAYLLEGTDAVRARNIRLWVNTLGPRFAAGRSDDKSMTDPDGNWGYLIDNGVNMIQTDRPAALIRYLLSRGARGGQ